ncbi:unnamed protein product [Nesidiocoris tenuis]|uniref:Integrase zinc-binding domain-containing protein n=1 Tax=Nesidiocoris tenuis TaxID=355587 RepID=A0A6H5HHP2_9HEMI|nr:unnamed protein product [Nesidiocoris tenuis]
MRMVGWLKRFSYNCRRQNQGQNLRGAVTVEELVVAENMVWRLVQEESFTSDSDDRLQELRPFNDDFGLIRVKTRISERNDQVSFTMPIVLPHGHPVVERMMRDYHVKNGHAGALTLAAQMRERFWILKSQRITRSVVKNCVTCRRHSGKICQTFNVLTWNHLLSLNRKCRMALFLKFAESIMPGLWNYAMDLKFG